MSVIPMALLLAVIASPAWSQTKKPSPTPKPWETVPPSTPPSLPQIGRYVAIQPQHDNTSGYANFLWVLDTATGDVSGYRITSLTEQGKHIGFFTEKLSTTSDYYNQVMSGLRPIPK